LSIEREGELCWTRSARIGGEDITEVIQKTLHISFEEAERLKIEKGVVYLSPAEEKSADETSRRVWEAMQPVVDELLTELQRSVSYFHSQLEGTKIDRILLTGGSSKLRNLDRLVSEQLGAEVKTLDPLKNITYSSDVLGDEELMPELGVAIGLALRSIEEGFSTIDLLPKIIISHRQLQKKKVYLVLSGLSMSLVLGIFSIFATQNCNTTQALLQNISAELTQYEKFESKISAVTAKQKKIKSKIDILSNLVAAREYWPNILLELSRVLPDNTHLKSLKVTEKTANVVELKGRTTNFDAVANLIARLEKSPLFGAVEVIEAGEAEEKTKRAEEPRRRDKRGRGTATREESHVAAGAKQTGIDFVLRVTLHRGMQMVEVLVESKPPTGEQRPRPPEGMQHERGMR
jgi:cell division ATPase FtsA